MTRERVLAAYMRTLTSVDIKRGRTSRAVQRKAGGSGKAIMEDINVPREPLSTYPVFLQQIHSDPALVEDVFGDETRAFLRPQLVFND